LNEFWSMIPADIIKLYKHSIKKLPADTLLFQEGDQCQYYYQVITGKIKMLNINPSGKEFVQGVFIEGQSFGEPPLFKGGIYPASARSIDQSILYKIHKTHFINLLRDHFEIHIKFTTTLSNRLLYKSMMMKEISSHDVEHRVITFIDYLKSEKEIQANDEFLVPFTRQQLSNLLGIRVETVIRTIKILEGKNLLKIHDGKVYR